MTGGLLIPVRQLPDISREANVIARLYTVGSYQIPDSQENQ